MKMLELLLPQNIFENVKERKERAPDKERTVEKLRWSEVYQNYSD